MNIFTIAVLKFYKKNLVFINTVQTSGVVNPKCMKTF